MKTLDQGTERSFSLDIVDWVENSGHISDPSDPAEILDVLVQVLYAVELSQERYDYFLYSVFLDYTGTDLVYARGLWTNEWNGYQSSSDDSVVRSLLQLLLSALIETPEFQLH